MPSSNLPLAFILNNKVSPFKNSTINNNNLNNSNVYYNSVVHNRDKRINNQNENNLYMKIPKSKNEQKKMYRKYKKKKPFDWICNRCSNLNYAFRTSCNICGLPLKENPYYNSNFD